MNDTVLRVQANQKKTITQLTAQTCPGCGGRPHQAGHSFAVPSLYCHLSLLPKGVQEYEFHFLQFPNTTYYHPYNSSQLITFTEWSFQQCLTNRTMEEKISHDIYNMVLSWISFHPILQSPLQVHVTPSRRLLSGFVAMVLDCCPMGHITTT